jgi:hypothetical protein
MKVIIAGGVAGGASRFKASSLAGGLLLRAMHAIAKST